MVFDGHRRRSSLLSAWHTLTPLCGRGSGREQNKGKGAGKAGKTLCYNCGSAEHSVHDCKAPPSEGGAAFRFASCFVCGEKGHISRECPQNAKGIYVKGGCCKLCQGACDICDPSLYYGPSTWNPRENVNERNCT